MNRIGNSGLAIALAALVWAAVIAPTVGVTPAHAASPVVEQAQKLYDSAKFDDAVAQLRDALGTGKVVSADAIAARALLARCLVKAGNRLEGKNEFVALLTQDPSWRPDPVVVPPDEMDVFNLAEKEFEVQQIHAGQRIPTSITANLGLLSSGRKDAKDLLSVHGGKSLDNGVQFGGAVRFPVSSRWSIDISIMHFGDKGTLFYKPGVFFATDTLDLETHALSVVGSAVYALRSGPKGRLNLVLGAGPLAQSELRIVYTGLVATIEPVQWVDSRTGVYVHGGVEGEYLVHKRIALLGLLDYREANSGKLNIGPYGGKEYFNRPVFDVNGRAVDWSGFTIQLGLRAYVGY